LNVVRIDCERCGRAERYRKDGLVARFDISLYNTEGNPVWYVHLHFKKKSDIAAIPLSIATDDPNMNLTHQYSQV